MTLPKGWVEKTFNDVGTYTDYVANGSFAALKENVTQVDTKDYAILLRLKDHSNSFKGPFKYVTEKSFKFLSKSELKPGDLFLANVGAPGKTFLVPDLGSPMTIAPNGVRVRATEISSNEFLNYYIKSPQGQDIIAAITGGNAQQKFNKTALKRSPVPLPPKEQQQLIVKKLDSVFEKLGMVQSRLDKVPLLLKRFRMSVLSAAVSGELTEEWRDANNADSWEHVSLKQVGKGFNYGSSAKSKKEGSVPVLRMGNLQDGKLDWSDLVYTSDEKEIEKYKLEPGDVLFNRTNSPELVGKTSIYRGERDAIFAGYLIKVQGTERLNSEYLNIQLNSPGARDYCWQVKTDGVSQSNINAQKLKAYEFNLPSIEEQEEIVRVVSELLAKSDLVKKQYEIAKLRVDKLTQSILARAFRGELFEPFTDKADRVAQPQSADVIDEQSTAAEETALEQLDKSLTQSQPTTKAVNDKSELLAQLKSVKNAMTVQQLFESVPGDTFKAIDELFIEVKRLLELNLVEKVGEGENCQFKATK
ncbi:restriction endonuclease subunit S [Vibrio vulnificus]|uniref:restriction endonuclease subunit S n=1 Tax=Vibrio vulnificus TaxID=672 RepID=UPI0032ECB867